MERLKSGCKGKEFIIGCASIEKPESRCCFYILAKINNDDEASYDMYLMCTEYMC